MCLSIAVHHPDYVLARGIHAGHEWAVVHNGNGYRCGYVIVPVGHPWHGKDWADLDPDVHGGLTFADADSPCGRDGAEDGWWIGFDCAHCGDALDPLLMTDSQKGLAETLNYYFDSWGAIRSQEYVEAECRSLCEQAACEQGV